MRGSMLFLGVGATVMLMASGAMARQTKVDICHNDEETGEYFVINISEKAVPAHLANHGDWMVTDEVCGDGLDNDCDGTRDEGCANPNSCEGRCGNHDENLPCQCDRTCFSNGNCCDDIELVCNASCDGLCGFSTGVCYCDFGCDLPPHEDCCPDYADICVQS